MENLTKALVEQGIESLGRYYSIYRAIVVKNVDPMATNRLKVAIPGIQGGLTLWALPKGQHGSKGTGFKYLCPRNGDIVFVSFEYGDPSKPLWEYHSWASKEMPKELDSPDVCGFVTPNGISVLFDDRDGSLDLYLPGEANIYSNNIINIGSKEKININSGNKGGVINIEDLTNKLNQLVREVDQLRNLLNTHTHVGVMSGPSTSGPTQIQSTSPISQFNKEDYEDKNFNH